MRNDEAHPADHARDADARGSDERGGDDDDDAGAPGVHAHGSGLVVAHGEDVDAPAQGEQRGAADEHDGEHHGDVAHVRAGERSHEPVGDVGELIGGVGHQFGVGDAGLEQRRHHDAGEHDHHHVVAAGPRTDKQHQEHGEQGEPEREEGRREGAHAQKNGDGRAECGALACAQNVGGDERILEGALVGGAGTGQTASHHEGQQNARQPYIEEECRLLLGPDGINWNDLADEHGHGLSRINGVAAQQKGDRGGANEDEGKGQHDKSGPPGGGRMKRGFCSARLHGIYYILTHE